MQVKTENEKALLSKLQYYYEQSLSVLNEFGGPSIYFHVQAIKEQKTNFLSERHIEMIYATLASWGMHKMGDSERTKTKLEEFAKFQSSILNQKERFEAFRKFRMEDLTKEDYVKILNDLKDVYRGIKVSISNASIVANSKTLAHILPHLIPPIDRQYTIRFFTQDNKNFFTNRGKYKQVNLPAGFDNQFALFKQYCCRLKDIFDYCDRAMFSLNENTFNSSYPKILDNLIIAFVKDIPKPS